MEALPMCDTNCILWVARNIAKKEITGKRVLEVGSYDVNGSVRPIIELLEPREYVGIDIAPGPGVDVICRAERLVEKFGRVSFDVVISITSLEHIKDWRGAISNMKNICKPGGLLIIIVPSAWPFHAYPHDYWRYHPEDIQNIFADCTIQTLEEDDRETSLVYAKIKKPTSFNEKDLSGYPLYSIILNRKIPDLNDRDYEKFIKRFKGKTVIGRIIRKIVPWPPEA
jgi:SAM-dependent methyltransferase